jgi:hypothetical protein
MTTTARTWDELTATERWGFMDRARRAYPTAGPNTLEAIAAQAHAQTIADGARAEAEVQAQLEQTAFYRDLASRIKARL